MAQWCGCDCYCHKQTAVNSITCPRCGHSGQGEISKMGNIEWDCVCCGESYGQHDKEQLIICKRFMDKSISIINKKLDLDITNVQECKMNTTTGLFGEDK